MNHDELREAARDAYRFEGPLSPHLLSALNHIETLKLQLQQAERDRDAARVMVALLLTRKDCPACDFGKLRNPENVGHWPECVYGQAERWLATGR